MVENMGCGPVRAHNSSHVTLGKGLHSASVEYMEDEDNTACCRAAVRIQGDSKCKILSTMPGTFLNISVKEEHTFSIIEALLCSRHCDKLPKLSTRAFDLKEFQDSRKENYYPNINSFICQPSNFRQVISFCRFLLPIKQR